MLFEKPRRATLMLFSVLFFSLSAYSQENYFVTQKGEKVLIYENEKEETTFYSDYILDGDISFTAQYFFYYTESGKQKKMKQSKIKELHFDGTYYLCLSIGSAGMQRLHEVLASNGKYLITNYFARANYFYIFDKNYKMVGKKMKHSWKRKDDYKSLNVVKKYFSNCPEILTIIKENIVESDYKTFHGDVAVVKNNMFSRLKNYQCQ